MEVGEREGGRGGWSDLGRGPGTGGTAPEGCVEWVLWWVEEAWEAGLKDMGELPSRVSVTMTAGVEVRTRVVNQEVKDIVWGRRGTAGVSRELMVLKEFRSITKMYGV